MKRFAVIVIALLAMVALVAGCGGGGGGTATITPTSATIRQLSIGDQVIYSATGIATDGTNTSQISGTITMTVHSNSRTPIYGNRALEIVTEVNATYNGMPVMYTNTGLIEQASDGTMYDLGIVGESLVSSTSPPVMYPSPTATGQAFSYTGTYSNGETYTHYYNVVDVENVAGYQSYKVHGSSTDGYAGDDWFVPDLGMPVKITSRTMDGGVLINLVGTLRSKNF